MAYIFLELAWPLFCVEPHPVQWHAFQMVIPAWVVWPADCCQDPAWVAMPSAQECQEYNGCWGFGVHRLHLAGDPFSLHR